VISGLGGDDRIDGGGGDDAVFGDAGDDAIDGGTGEDTIYGGDGDTGSPAPTATTSSRVAPATTASRAAPAPPITRAARGPTAAPTPPGPATPRTAAAELDGHYRDLRRASEHGERADDGEDEHTAETASPLMRPGRTLRTAIAGAGSQVEYSFTRSTTRRCPTTATTTGASGPAMRSSPSTTATRAR
jgi:hypothetical protein